MLIIIHDIKCQVEYIHNVTQRWERRFTLVPSFGLIFLSAIVRCPSACIRKGQKYNKGTLYYPVTCVLYKERQERAREIFIHVHNIWDMLEGYTYVDKRSFAPK